VGKNKLYPSLRTWSQLWEINYVKISGVSNIHSMCLCFEIAFVFPFPFVLPVVLFLFVSLFVFFFSPPFLLITVYGGLSHSQTEETDF